MKSFSKFPMVLLILRHEIVPISLIVKEESFIDSRDLIVLSTQ
jgi:hypothetical protein